MSRTHQPRNSNRSPFAYQRCCYNRHSIRSGSDKFRARQPGWRRYGALSEQSLDARNENVPKRSLQEK